MRRALLFALLNHLRVPIACTHKKQKDMINTCHRKTWSMLPKDLIHASEKPDPCSKKTWSIYHHYCTVAIATCTMYHQIWLLARWSSFLTWSRHPHVGLRLFAGEAMWLVYSLYRMGLRMFTRQVWTWINIIQTSFFFISLAAYVITMFQVN